MPLFGMHAHGQSISRQQSQPDWHRHADPLNGREANRGLLFARAQNLRQIGGRGTESSKTGDGYLNIGTV